MTAVVERPVTPVMYPTPPPERQYVDELTLAALQSAVGCAQLLVRHALHSRRLRQQDADTAERLLGELVAHAVATTGVATSLPIYDDVFDHLALISVRLQFTPDSLGMEVWDTGTTPPEAQRGLSQVAADSRDWGYYLSTDGERVVWCDVAARAPEDGPVETAG